MKYIVLFLALCSCSLSQLKAEVITPEYSMPVEAVLPSKSTWEESLHLIGMVSSVSSVQITSEIEGRIKAIYFQDGELVKQGQALIALDNAIAKANLDQAQARLALSKKHYERKKALVIKGSITNSELEEALANLRVDEASLALAQASFEKTILTAPFSGKLGLKQVSIGAYISPGKALVSLEANEILQIDFTVPEAYLSFLNKQTSLVVRVPSLPDKKFTANIIASEPSLEVHSRGLKVRALLKSEDILKAGQFAEVAYVFFREENVLSLPETAIVSNLNGAVVYTIIDKHIKIVPVKIGRRHKGRVQILDGVEDPSMQVVISGQMKLKPGALVQVIN
jgi:membrane fusion protein (multidrug efflux system)